LYSQSRHGMQNDGEIYRPSLGSNNLKDINLVYLHILYRNVNGFIPEKLGGNVSWIFPVLILPLRLVIRFCLVWSLYVRLDYVRLG
jgi:hypothetical protein